MIAEVKLAERASIYVSFHFSLSEKLLMMPNINNEQRFGQKKIKFENRLETWARLERSAPSGESLAIHVPVSVQFIFDVFMQACL